MVRLSQAIAAVMAGTIASGLAGGLVGATVGHLAPSFVAWLRFPWGEVDPRFNPVEFALGLGVVSGLLLGATASLFLAVVILVRDAILPPARPDRKPPTDVELG